MDDPPLELPLEEEPPSSSPKPPLVLLLLEHPTTTATAATNITDRRILASQSARVCPKAPGAATGDPVFVDSGREWGEWGAGLTAP